MIIALYSPPVRRQHFIWCEVLGICAGTCLLNVCVPVYTMIVYAPVYRCGITVHECHMAS
jgi:hypothetical protein